LELGSPRALRAVTARPPSSQLSPPFSGRANALTQTASVRRVSALRIRRQLRRQHRRLTVIATVLALACMIAVHHSGLAMATHHEMPMSAVAEMCLGVFTAVGAAVAAVGFTLLALGRWRPAPLMLPRVTLPPQRVPRTRSRHGPLLLSLLCVSRR
jgi:hypothetical protein